MSPAIETINENHINALEHIRQIAALHYVGGAFDPEHMRTLANIAADALAGREIPPMPDPGEIEERARQAAEKYAGWFS